MPKQRANGPRWPGMLQSSKDRAKPIAVDFVRDFLFRRELSPPSWAATADHVEILCSLDPTRRGSGWWSLLRLRLPGGCGATETAGAISPLREFRSLAPAGGDEDLLQHLPLHRLLHDRHIAEPAVDALDAIAGYENERNFPRHQHVGDRVDEFSAEIDIDDTRIDIVVHGGDHGLGQPAEGSNDRKSEFGQNVLHHHGDQNLVFDHKDAVAGLKLKRKRKRRPVLARSPMGAGTVRQRLDAVAAGHAQAAVQAFRPPMERGLARELT